MKKIHKTAENSIIAYMEVLSSGKVAKEKLVVLNTIIKNQPCTSRMLSKITGIERTNITRSLNDLVNIDRVIKEAFSAPCKTTGRTVYHYTLIDWQWPE